jgi:hypothetical protein
VYLLSQLVRLASEQKHESIQKITQAKMGWHVDHGIELLPSKQGALNLNPSDAPHLPPK